DQRIEPDIEDVIAFDRQRDAPFDRGAADGEILQALLDEADYFIAARSGLDPLGIVLVELQQAVREGGELEEVILFGDRFGRAATIRAGIAGLGVIHVELVIDAVLTRIASLVDITVVEALLEEPLDGLMMPRIGGPDGAVNANPERFPLLLKLL